MVEKKFSEWKSTFELEQQKSWKHIQTLTQTHKREKEALSADNARKMDEIQSMKVKLSSQDALLQSSELRFEMMQQEPESPTPDTSQIEESKDVSAGDLDGTFTKKEEGDTLVDGDFSAEANELNQMAEDNELN